MNTSMKPPENPTDIWDTPKNQSVEDEFKKKFCWKDTDGKWFLNANPLTVPELLHWFKEELQKAREEERDSICVAMLKDKKSYSDAINFINALTSENQ